MTLTLEVLDEKKLLPNVVAITSLCNDGNHIIIWDFDTGKNPTAQNKIENSLVCMMQRHFLSKVFIFETRNGYNAVCLDKLSATEVYKIKDETAFDDRRHSEHGLQTGRWKFRAGKEKKFIGGIDLQFNAHNKSNAHRITLNRWYKLNVPKDKYFDDEAFATFEAYWCWKEECEKKVKKDVVSGQRQL